jgi:uncharacterized protein YeeX (DUF496 family)
MTMTPETIDSIVQIVSGVCIAVAGGFSGFYFKKVQKTKPTENQKIVRVPRSSCDNHKEVIDNVKQIPLILSGLGYLKERFEVLETDIKEVFRVLRDHEGEIENIKGLQQNIVKKVEVDM